MGLTQNLGRLSPSIFSDASLNIGVGAAPSGSYKFEVTGTSKVSGVLTLGSTLSNGTYTYTLPAATGTLALVGGAGVGTVTSVAALTIGTTGTDLSSSVATSTTTPVITLNVPTASAANRGALSSADWSTFNSKQGTITLTTTGTSGAATFTSNTLNIPDYGSALSGYLPLTGGTLTGDLSIAYTTANLRLFLNNTTATTGRSWYFNSYSNGNLYVGNTTAGDIFNFSSAGVATFSGALNGTSASFSSTGRFIGALTIGTDFAQLLPISSSNYQLLVGNYYDGTNLIATATSGSRTVYNVGGMDFRTFTGATVGSSVTDTSRFTIANTGAATFSSTVQINDSLQIDNSVLNTPKSITFVANCSAGGNTALGSISWKNTQWDNNIKAQIQAATGADITEGQLLFKTGASNAVAVTRLTISASGAATFSSNVNVNTYLSLGTGSGKFLAVGGAVTAGSSADILMYNTGGDIIFWATGAVGMIIKATSGNIGINTTGPRQKLDTAGAIRASAGSVDGDVIAAAYGRTLYKVMISSNYDGGNSVRAAEWNILTNNEGTAITNVTQVYIYNGQSATFSISGGNIIVNSLPAGNNQIGVYTN